jgi:peptidyl-prolyl cis-trans isomerase B (cyclophilin B)
MSQQQPPYGPPQQQPDDVQQPYAPAYQPNQPYAVQPYYVQPYNVQPAYFVAPRPTNGLAIAAFVSVWFVSILGIILGHIALSQVKRTGEGGHGLALAALVLGYVFLGLVVLFLLFYVVVLIGILGVAATTVGTVNS